MSERNFWPLFNRTALVFSTHPVLLHRLKLDSVCLCFISIMFNLPRSCCQIISAVQFYSSVTFIPSSLNSLFISLLCKLSSTGLISEFQLERWLSVGVASHDSEQFHKKWRQNAVLWQMGLNSITLIAFGWFVLVSFALLMERQLNYEQTCLYK